MSAVIIVSIIFGSLVVLAGLLCGTVLVILRTRRSSDPKSVRDEAMLMQDIYQGLERMEKRIEALETILMDGRDQQGEKQ